jgi:flagellar protein FliL
MIRGNDGKAKIIIIAVVLILICSVAGVAVFAKKGHKGAKKSEIPEGPATMVSIGEMVVNLADTDEIRYVKADIVLEVHGKMEAAGGEGEGGGAAANAPLRDAIISVLSSKRFGDINKAGGKDTLKTEIMTGCNKHLKEAKVTSVYFNQFAMQ